MFTFRERIIRMREEMSVTLSRKWEATMEYRRAVSLWMSGSKAERQLEHTLTRLPNPIISDVINALQNPSVAKSRGEKQVLLSIGFGSDANGEGGDSHDTWSSFTKNLLLLITPPKERKDSVLACSLSPVPKKTHYSLGPAAPTPSAPPTTAEIKAESPDSSKKTFSQLTEEGWKFSRLLGRTILLQKEEKILAIKVRKIEEESLQKEFLATAYLKEHAETLGLKTKFPTANL